MMEQIEEKIKAGIRLTEDELSRIPWESAYVEEIEGAEHRWTREVTTIFQIGDDFYALDWRRALTEMQEHEFWEQPYKVKKVEEVVTVHRWVPVKD